MPTSQVKQVRRKEGKKCATSTTAPPSLKKNQGSAGLKNSESSTSNWSTTGEGQVGIGCIPVKPKLSRRFYEALVLLAVLGQNRGDRIDEESFESEDDPSGLDIKQLRRSFIRHLAYLCDYDKGGDQTTAIALEQTPQGITYWFASNKCPGSASGTKDKAKAFLEDVLESAAGVQSTLVSEVELDLFEKSILFSSRRIAFYSQCLRNDVEFVLEGLDKLHLDHDLSFISWLRNLENAMDSPRIISKVCYDSRRSEECRSLQTRAKQGEPCSSRFESIRHLIGRLNHTMKAVKVVVAASLRIPILFDEVQVMRARSPQRSSPPLKPGGPSLDEIVGRMMSAPTEIANYRDALRDMDHRFHLSESLQKQCSKLTWKPKVHAELILLDMFWTGNLGFVGQDRYIGCSKAACYCCYHYMKEHPGNFFLPACHNNVHLNWKAPDVFDSADSGQIKAREGILNKMVTSVRQEILTQINERRGPRGWRPDSSTEISTLHQEEGLLSQPVSEAEGESDQYSSEEYLPALSDVESVATDLSRRENETEPESEEEEDEDSDGGVALEH